MASLALSITKSVENITKSVEEITESINAINYNYDRRLRQEESHSGNKRIRHASGLTTKPEPTKRQKKSQQFAAVEKTTTALSKVSEKPNYSFRARNSMFPDPYNCKSFELHNESPLYRPQKLNAATTTKKIAMCATTKTTHQPKAPTTWSTNHRQQSRLPQHTGSNLKDIRGSQSQSANAFAGGKSKGLAMTKNPRSATKFKKIAA